MKKHVIIKLLVFVVSMAWASGEESDSDKRIKWLVSEIIGCFDSIPPRELYNELRKYGSESRPIMEKMLCTTKGSDQERLVYLFAGNQKYSDYALSFLRNYAKQNCLITENNKSAIYGILSTLSYKGRAEDLDLIKSFETNVNPFVAAYAVEKREALELRLKESEKPSSGLEKDKTLPVPPVLNNTDVVDKTPRMIVPQEVVAPNVQPNQKRTSRKAFPYLVVIGGSLLGVLGSLVVVARKRLRKSE